MKEGDGAAARRRLGQGGRESEKEGREREMPTQREGEAWGRVREEERGKI